jgi:hypothetical protein
VAGRPLVKFPVAAVAELQAVAAQALVGAPLDDNRDRIERIAATMGDPRRVLAGTDCGFDTSAGMGRVAEDVVWAKLRALKEGAQLASQRLFAS